MSPHLLEEGLIGLFADTREQVLFNPSGDALLVDGLGTLVRKVPVPVKHIWDDVPLVAPAGRPFSDAPPSTFTVVGVAEGERTAVLSLEVADIDASTMDMIDGPTRIDLPKPAAKVRLQYGSVIALKYLDSEATRYQFRNTAGAVLAEATLPTPVEWAVLAGDSRHVVASNASDDSVRVVDTRDGRVTVLPVYAEPQEPDMLSDGRFMIQTREGQYELWDARVRRGSGRSPIRARMPGPGRQLPATSRTSGSCSTAPGPGSPWTHANGAIVLALWWAGPSRNRSGATSYPANRPYNDACAATA